MRIEQTVRINEAMESVWAVLIDGANWPEWTASTSSAKRLEHAPFGLGSRTTVSQPKLRTTTWTVTEFEPPRSLTWAARPPGLTLVGTHALCDAGSGSVNLTLTLVQDGIVGRLLAPLTVKIAGRCVEMEATGLKMRLEAGH
jgi:uncharacterized protein YndB with AHSA1/START domain